MSRSLSQFLLGIDLSSVSIGDHDCSSAFGSMGRLEWLKLSTTDLKQIPKGVEKLTQLQRLTISKNQINCLNGDWYENLKSLRVFNARKNCLTDDNIPNGLFNNTLLQVVDLSFNNLTEIPVGLMDACSLLVLNLSDNKIISVPKELFSNCASLMMIDLSNNEITTFPTNLRRMPNLQSLNLSNNPLQLAQLRSICGLKKLITLSLSNTARRLENFPPDIDKLPNLADLDVSENGLPKIPQTIYEVMNLTKLNLSGNEIDEISSMLQCWPNLEVLNLSRNRLSSLPSFITRLSKLKKLYLDTNKLTFNGIPTGMGKLVNLEVFSAAENLLENIPEGLCRCGQLRLLNLHTNRLVTLPDAIHVLVENLTVFNIDNNPDLRMPPRLDEADRVANNAKQRTQRAFYNIDFSLETQMQLVRGAPARLLEKANTQKDTASRIRRLRRKKLDDSGTDDKSGGDSKRVLEGMKKVAKDKESMVQESEEETAAAAQASRNRRWQDHLNKPDLDYSKLFEDDVGSSPGIEIWDIDDFYPRLVREELMLGSFYKGDCYIVLHTSFTSENGSNSNHHGSSQLTQSIYYWIGNEATLDKVTCAAMHAVNLRNFVRAECRCERLEQGEESQEFLTLFGGHIQVLEGANGETGFMHSEKKQHRKKLYRLFGGPKSLSVFACDVRPQSLDSKFAYLFDESPSYLYVWLGSSSSLMLQKKARLLADKINQRERKNLAQLVVERDGFESDEFRTSILECSGGEWPDPRPNCVGADWQPPPAILYEVKQGRGYLEIPQLPLGPRGLLKRTMLQPGHVYILDSHGDLFLWLGELSPKFLKFAALKLAYELVEMLPRESKRSPIICTHKSEPHIFKMQFADWEETLAVDFTRSAESVRTRGVDMNEIMEKDKIKIDMKAFFMPREKPTSWEDAANIMEECNEDLVLPVQQQGDPELELDNPCLTGMRQFVYQGRKWVPVEARWTGHFFSGDCYIIHAEYWDYPDEDEEEDKDEEDEDKPPRIMAVVYFWQGRDASNIPWLQFNFSVLPEMQARLGGGDSSNGEGGNSRRKVEFKRMYQQQEMTQFLAHFRYRFVVHQGLYAGRYEAQRRQRCQLYYTRDNGNPLCVRTIEVKPMYNFLNSHFHYVLRVPAALAKTERDQVVCWIGGQANKQFDEIVQTLAHDLVPNSDPNEAEFICVREGCEPDFFWACLTGGKSMTAPNYDREAEFMQYTRLFRLSNEQGFFCASEKCSDFCQDDLADEDVMLLDTGSQIYVWYGSRTSEVEKKLSLQAAKLYKEHMLRLQPTKTRALKVTGKKLEAQPFRRCFHGWGSFKEAKDWSG